MTTSPFNSLIQIGSKLLVVIFLISNSSCVDSGMEKLTKENEELKLREIHRDSIMRNLVEVFATVDSNMRAIKKNELLIQRQVTVKDGSSIKEDSILYYVSQIDTLVKYNKKLVSELETHYGAQNLNILGIRQLISSLNDKNQFKSNEVGELKSRLATINEDFRRLFEDFVFTEVEKMELNEYNLSLKNKNEALLKELNTAYYKIGSKSELREKGLTNSKGIFFDPTLNENFDKELFTEIDIRDLSFVNLDTKKAKIISKHPEDSYELVISQKKAVKLLIKEPKEFWSLSKYLLIEVEN